MVCHGLVTNDFNLLRTTKSVICGSETHIRGVGPRSPIEPVIRRVKNPEHQTRRRGPNLFRKQKSQQREPQILCEYVLFLLHEGVL